MKTISVKAISAAAMTKPQLDKVVKAVEAKYPGAKIDIETEINEKFLGGLKLIVNSVEYDATVSGKLEKLRSHLIAKL